MCVGIYRHSLARSIDGDGHQTVANTSQLAATTSTANRLRRSSSVDAPNVSLLTSSDGGAADSEAIIASRKPFKIERQSSIEEIELVSCNLKPNIEGRIIILNDINLPSLMDERLKWEISSTRTIQESTQEEGVEQ